MTAHAQLTMQTTDWTAHQLMTGSAHRITSELGQWTQLPEPFSRPHYSQMLEPNCVYSRRYQPHLAPPTSYLQQVSRDWIANYFSYHRLKQLCWSNGDTTPSRTASAMGVDVSSRWSSNGDGQTICGDVKEQLSNGT